MSCSSFSDVYNGATGKNWYWTWFNDKNDKLDKFIRPRIVQYSLSMFHSLGATFITFRSEYSCMLCLLWWGPPTGHSRSSIPYIHLKTWSNRQNEIFLLRLRKLVKSPSNHSLISVAKLPRLYFLYSEKYMIGWMVDVWTVLGQTCHLQLLFFEVLFFEILLGN